jgi:hypothetical protein
VCDDAAGNLGPSNRFLILDPGDPFISIVS